MDSSVSEMSFDESSSAAPNTLSILQLKNSTTNWCYSMTFPWFSTTPVIFHDYPGPEFFFLKFQDFLLQLSRMHGNHEIRYFFNNYKELFNKILHTSYTSICHKTGMFYRIMKRTDKYMLLLIVATPHFDVIKNCLTLTEFKTGANTKSVNTFFEL